MDRLIISGAGTEVGKTVVAAIFANMFQADYWKPVSCGPLEESDSQIMKALLHSERHTIHPSTYHFNAPVSPHHSARLKNESILSEQIKPPATQHPLIIEMVGGVLVPLTLRNLTVDLFAAWKGKWVIVSKHYVGSINHTLLTIEALQNRNIDILGIFFNGVPNPDTEEAILQISNLPFLGRMLPEKQISTHTIQHYANLWKPLVLKALHHC